MHVLIRKLRALHTLSPEEENALLAVLSAPVSIPAQAFIVDDGDTPTHSTVILSGTACRQKILDDGERQIIAFELPGDFTDLYSYVLRRMDHGVRALTDCMVAHVPHKDVEKLSVRFPNLGYALWRDTLVDASIFQIWLVNMGRRSALERLAHLLCEQFFRRAAVGLAVAGRPVDLHVTQTDLADATGISATHVNRTLQELRGMSLIGRDPQKLEILDWAGLKQIAGFDPSYLHYRHVQALA